MAAWKRLPRGRSGRVNLQLAHKPPFFCRAMGALAARQKTDMYLLSVNDQERGCSDEGTGAL